MSSKHNQYKNPRRNVTNTSEQFAAQDRAAAVEGIPWAEWIRRRTHLEPLTPKKTRKMKA